MLLRHTASDSLTPPARRHQPADFFQAEGGHTAVHSLVLTGRGAVGLMPDAHVTPAETRYTLTVESWLGRMNLGSEAVEAAYSLFANADDHARKVFAIEYGAGRALRFEMPMALILVVKVPS